MLKKTCQTKYLNDALVVTSKTTTTIDAVSHFKLILQKAKEDRHLDQFTVNKLDRQAENCNTAQAPFVQDICNYLRCLDKRISNVEGRLDNVEGRLDNVEGHLESIESRIGQLTKMVKKKQIKKLSAYFGKK